MPIPEFKTIGALLLCLLTVSVLGAAIITALLVLIWRSQWFGQVRIGAAILWFRFRGQYGRIRRGWK